MNKKVLLLSTFYHPSSASGVHRVVANSKYLQRFGWQPYVVTKLYSSKHPYQTYDPRLDGRADPCTVFRIGHPHNRVLALGENYFWKFFGGADDHRKPYILYRRMLRCAARLIEREKISAVWATSRGPMVHKVASQLYLRYRIPWIADFRDLPDQTYDNRDTRLAVKQEIASCANAAILTATTSELAARLKQRHTQPVHVICNGYDPEEYGGITDLPKVKSLKFCINHFGVVYPYRDPAALFSAMDLLIEKNPEYANIEVNFFGADPAVVLGFAATHRCSRQIKCPGRLPYDDMLKQQCASQVLLVVSPPEQGGAIPAKIYGYLASKRPVLVVPGDKAGTERLMYLTQAGLCSDVPEQISDWISGQFRQWSETGQTVFCGLEREIMRYSRIGQSETLAKLLDSII